jgi:hypothetical protein
MGLVALGMFQTLSLMNRVIVLEEHVSSFQKDLVMAHETMGGLRADLAMERNNLRDLQGQISRVQTSPVMDLGPYVTVEKKEFRGLRGPHVVFTGANVHIRSGSGYTDDGISKGHVLTGLGNLVVGYNEEPTGGLIRGDRSGSHNIMTGSEHRFSGFGGLVAGFRSTIRGDYATVSGGALNTASGSFSSISGGLLNIASGDISTVTGGSENIASGDAASVTGGAENKASGTVSIVNGGRLNIASGDHATVTGGSENRASGAVSSVSGGRFNLARGEIAGLGTDEPGDKKGKGDVYNLDQLSLSEGALLSVNGDPAVSLTSLHEQP